MSYSIQYNDPDTETKYNYLISQFIGVSFGRKDNSSISNITEAMRQLLKQKYETDMLNIRNPTEFLERCSRLCMFGINVVPEMRYNISHAYKNGEGAVLIDIKFPKKFLNDDEAGINQAIQIKDRNEKIIKDSKENHFSNGNEETLFTSLEDLNGSGVTVIRTTNELFEKLSRLCLFGIKLIPDMLFSISHTHNNGEECVQVEIRVPKKCLNEGKTPLHTSTEKESQGMQVIENLDNDANITNGEVRGCNVCGDKTSKYCHYGGRSCQSCRAFFRRSVLKSSR